MRIVYAAFLALWLALAGGTALAQEESAGESRAATFEAATGAQAEEVPGGTLLIAAYGVAWILVLGYVVSLGFRQARTQEEITRLRADLEAHEEHEAAAGGEGGG